MYLVLNVYTRSYLVVYTPLDWAPQVENAPEVSAKAAIDCLTDQHFQYYRT